MISAVVPHVQKASMGVDENVVNVLAGFKITLSPDRHEAVQIIVYYIWCVEGEHKQNQVQVFRQFSVYALGTLLQQGF